MLRNLIAFCLSRRPLVLISFAAFLALGYAAFTDPEHRGLSRSCAADHRDHRPVSRPVAGRDGALRHDPDRDRRRQHAGAEVSALQHRLCAQLHPAAVRIRPRLLLRPTADDQSAQGRGAPGCRAAGHLARGRHQRDLPLPAQGPAGHGRHAAQDAAGLGGGAQAAHRARRGRRPRARRQDQAVSGRDRPQSHDRARLDAAADHQCDFGRAIPTWAAGPSPWASSR